MIFNNLSDNLHHISEKFKDYTESSVEYYKLRLFKSAMKGAISLVNLMVFGGIFLFVLFFITVGIALWLGDILDNFYLGFFIVGGFYAILFFFIIFFGKGLIEKAILIKFSKLVFEEEAKSPKEVAKDEVDRFHRDVVAPESQGNHIDTVVSTPTRDIKDLNV